MRKPRNPPPAHETISGVSFFDPKVARAARAWTGLEQISLAEAAHVSSHTVWKLEDDGWVTPASLTKILAALHRCGVTFWYDDRGHPCGMTFKVRRVQKPKS